MTEKTISQQEREGRLENTENTEEEEEEEGYREEGIEEERKGRTGGRNFKKKRLGWGGSGWSSRDKRKRGSRKERTFKEEQKKERAFLLAKDFLSYGGSLLRRWQRFIIRRGVEVAHCNLVT